MVIAHFYSLEISECVMKLIALHFTHKVGYDMINAFKRGQHASVLALHNQIHVHCGGLNQFSLIFLGT
jgi:hypothetical protein